MARKTGSNGNGANLGFEQTLWLAADKLRNNLDAAEYKHVVLGLIFLKYISDAFAEVHAKLAAQQGEGADPEDPDEYRAVGVFWVPPEARWASLQAKAKQPTIGKLADEVSSTFVQLCTVNADEASLVPYPVESRQALSRPQDRQPQT
jgi:type I restriction enzyme M protein